MVKVKDKLEHIVYTSMMAYSPAEGSEEYEEYLIRARDGSRYATERILARLKELIADGA